MATYVHKIEELIPFLPTKDIELGLRFLHKRDFGSLKELVDSVIIKYRKNIRLDNPNPELSKIDVDQVEVLKSYIYNYITQLGLEGDDEDLSIEPPFYDDYCINEEDY